MGCKQTKVTPFKQTSPEEALTGKINCPHELYYAKCQVTRPTPRLSGPEILQQLRDEGLVPDRQSSGGVAFSVPAVEGLFPVAKLPDVWSKSQCDASTQLRGGDRRLIYSDWTGLWSKSRENNWTEKSSIYKAVKDEKKRRQFLKKMRAEHQLQMREEKLKKLEEERAAKRPNPAKK